MKRAWLVAAGAACEHGGIDSFVVSDTGMPCWEGTRQPALTNSNLSANGVSDYSSQLLLGRLSDA